MTIVNDFDNYYLDSDSFWSDRCVFKMYFYFKQRKYNTLKRFHSEIKRKTPSP